MFILSLHGYRMMDDAQVHSSSLLNCINTEATWNDVVV